MFHQCAHLCNTLHWVLCTVLDVVFWCSEFCLFTRQDGEVYLYGIFDGHSGGKVASFAAQRMPEEILLGQLHGKVTDEEIKDVLKQVFNILWSSASVVTYSLRMLTLSYVWLKLQMHFLMSHVTFDQATATKQAYSHSQTKAVCGCIASVRVVRHSF